MNRARAPDKGMGFSLRADGRQAFASGEVSHSLAHLPEPHLVCRYRLCFCLAAIDALASGEGRHCWRPSPNLTPASRLTADGHAGDFVFPRPALASAGGVGFALQALYARVHSAHPAYAGATVVASCSGRVRAAR